MSEETDIIEARIVLLTGYVSKLDAAIAGGYKSVRLNNRTAEFQSILQLREARDEYAAEKNLLLSSLNSKRNRRPRAYRARVNRRDSY